MYHNQENPGKHLLRSEVRQYHHDNLTNYNLLETSLKKKPNIKD